MKLAIILTVTCVEEDNSDFEGFLREYIEYVKLVYKANEYSINKLGVGIHKNATRLHAHITTILEIDPKHDVKHWNKKLTALIKMDNPAYELRRTPYRDSDPKYNEDSAISYLFKEYESDDQVVLTDTFIGIDNWSELRESGNNQYVKAMAEQERTALRKKQEEDENENIAQFIRDYIHPRNRSGMVKEFPGCSFDALGEFTLKYKVIKVGILKYYQQRFQDTGRRNFKAYSVRDKAISFMTSENLCSLIDIADFLS